MEKLKEPGTVKPAMNTMADVSFLSQTVKNVSSEQADPNPKKKLEVPKTSDLCSALGMKCK